MSGCEYIISARRKKKRKLEFDLSRNLSVCYRLKSEDQKLCVIGFNSEAVDLLNSEVVYD